MCYHARCQYGSCLTHTIVEHEPVFFFLFWQFLALGATPPVMHILAKKGRGKTRSWDIVRIDVDWRRALARPALLPPAHLEPLPPPCMQGVWVRNATKQTQTVPFCTETRRQNDALLAPVYIARRKQESINVKQGTRRLGPKMPPYQVPSC